MKFQPYLLRDSAMYVQTPIIACAPTFCGVLGVHQQVFMPGLSVPVVDRALLTELDSVRRFTPWEDSSVQDVISGIKPLMLAHGATPEAVRLIGELSPFNAKELKTMAEKLAKKGKTPAADKAAPAEKPAKGPKGKGNAEALAKARAAKAEAGPDTRKIKVLNKENPYREGSNRAAAFDALKGAKTVEEFVAAGGKTKYLSRWVDEERIALG